MSRVILIVLAIALSGCAARRAGTAKVPGCDVDVCVPKGCYTQTFADHLEIRCDGHTTTMRCKLP